MGGFSPTFFSPRQRRRVLYRDAHVLKLHKLSQKLRPFRARYKEKYYLCGMSKEMNYWMRRYIILIVASVLMMVGCTDNAATKHVPQAKDSLYTEERAMEIYGREPEGALRIIDSAEIVGNVSDFRAELLRARVYAYPNDAMNLDTARQMGGGAFGA